MANELERTLYEALDAIEGAQVNGSHCWCYDEPTSAPTDNPKEIMCAMCKFDLVKAADLVNYKLYDNDKG